MSAKQPRRSDDCKVNKPYKCENAKMKHEQREREKIHNGLWMFYTLSEGKEKKILERKSHVQH